jgi:large subunit ribosomal protein L19
MSHIMTTLPNKKLSSAQLVQKIEQEHQAKSTKVVPVFSAGDILRVQVRIKEGEKERLQTFEGLCIARSNAGFRSNFTVRKLSNGEGVERQFPLYSPVVAAIEVVRRGQVRRAKLFYMRGLTGKAARIKEKVTERPAKTAAKSAAA